MWSGTATTSVPCLSTPLSFVDFLLLVFVQNLKVGAPQKKFFGGYRVFELRKAHTQFLGHTKLKHEPIIFTQLAG